MHRILCKSLQSRAGAGAGAGALFRQQLSELFWRSFSQLHSPNPSYTNRPSFGIAFDIDGVLLRGSTPIGGSPVALNRLYHPSGSLKIPYIFLTNGGGVRESKRALELSELFGVTVLPSQVLHGHSPFKQLVNRYLRLYGVMHNFLLDFMIAAVSY